MDTTQPPTIYIHHTVPPGHPPSTSVVVHPSIHPSFYGKLKRRTSASTSLIPHILNERSSLLSTHGIFIFWPLNYRIIVVTLLSLRGCASTHIAMLASPDRSLTLQARQRWSAFRSAGGC
ncbi:hypothetical protein BS78_08G024900 [Paspalum vaginatum]|nr:hypothetical protein BS78_08G024900 [Paspalum vaginatum]